MCFTNGELNVNIVLLDGLNSVPKMAINSGVLEINSVQQGDRIIIEGPITGCREGHWGQVSTLNKVVDGDRGIVV